MDSGSGHGWQPLDYDVETAWLRERTPSSGPNSGGATTGYEPTGYEHAIWVLHAMYEPIESKPVPIATHDATGIGAGSIRQPDRRRDVDFEPLGVANPEPGPGWRRVRWSELAERLGSRLQGQPYPPCFRWFPDEGWPADLLPPSEGSLDQPTARRLVAHLAHVSDSPHCIAAYSFLAGGWREPNLCFAGSVDRLLDLCADGLGTPSNFWALDRTWFAYTDWDLWATKVNGPVALIAALEADPELETITWPDP